MDVKLLHSLPEENVNDSPGDFSYFAEDGELLEEETGSRPLLLTAIASLTMIGGGMATLIFWGSAILYPGSEFANRVILEINVFYPISLIPAGMLAPLLAITGYGLLIGKRWGFYLYAFLLGMSVSTAVYCLIKFPGYATVVKKTTSLVNGFFYQLQYGWLFVDFLIYFYLMTEKVRDFYKLTKYETIKLLIVALLVSLSLGGLITFFSASIFGWNSIVLGYKNTQWFR